MECTGQLSGHFVKVLVGVELGTWASLNCVYTFFFFGEKHSKIRDFAIIL